MGPVAQLRALWHLRLVRFVLVGVVNTGFSYLAYVFFLWLGLGYAWANLLALVLGVLFSFRTQGALVFRDTDPRRIFRFVAAWGLIWPVNVWVIGGFISLGLDAYAAGALALPISAVLSYLVQRWLVFRPAVKVRDGP